MKELNLDTKVTITDGRFSTLSLSDGQKRRLALLVAFFYYSVLTELKNKGKAVVVISHDDRYFDVADKILVMEEGQLADCITDSEVIYQKTQSRTIVSDKRPEAEVETA